MAYLNETNKVYRIVINPDPDSVDQHRDNRLYSPESLISLAQADANRMYGTKAAAKGMLTRIKRAWAVEGWIEESDLNWSKSS